MKKKLFSLFLIFLMCLTFSNATVFAIEKQPEVICTNNEDIPISNLGVEPRVVVYLRTIDLTTYTGTLSFTVTPAAGSNLKVVVSNRDSGSLLYVSRNGVDSYILKANTTDTYSLVNNCDGGQYTVYFHTEGIATIVGYIVQTDY